MKTPRSLCGAVSSGLLLSSAFAQIVNAQSTLFSNELIQLTEADLDALNDSSVASLFQFGDSNSTSDLATRSSVQCKLYPGDALWPGSIVWSAFNWLLGGALIKTTPPAASCYSSRSEYDSDECDYVTEKWGDSYFHSADPASVMWPLFEGLTCEPTDDPSGNCTQGAYPVYAVNVSTVTHIQLAVNFARITGMRLIVKNTGHDFNGKSAGAGALSIWTHHLKDVEYFENYMTTSYNGPAFKVGSGIQAYELYAAAHARGLTLIGGEGKTVGVAGGYVAGGGHSPLSSIYGLAADQVLSMQVVLPSGRFVTASDEENTDLFWALRGGGGSTFGVVTSVVFRAHPKIGVTVSTFSFSTGTNVSVDTFWAGIRAYYEQFVNHTNAGVYSYFWIMPLGNDSYTFIQQPMFGAGLTLDQFNTLMEPWFTQLEDLGISITPNSTYYDDFYDAWSAGFPLETVGAETRTTGSRLFPRENWEDETLLNKTIAAHRSTVEAGYPLLAFNIKADAPSFATENSANPAWRNTLMHAITSASWDAGTSNADILATMDKMTNDILGQWRDVSPGAGAYMSEADVLEPNFQQAFYGTNYDRLYELKQQYDPTGLFYAPTAVGSEDWVVKSVSGLPDQNGRLCRA